MTSESGQPQPPDAALLARARDGDRLAFRGLKAFEGRSSVRTWLTGILIRQAAMLRRRAGRKEARLVPLTGASEAGLAVPSTAPAADARIDVMAAIRELSPEHRDVVILREFEGLSYSQMAEVLGIPQGTVESRLFRARRQLQERLKEYLD